MRNKAYRYVLSSYREAPFHLGAPYRLDFVSELRSLYPDARELDSLNLGLILTRVVRCGYKNGSYWFLFPDREAVDVLSCYKIPFFYTKTTLNDEYLVHISHVDILFVLYALLNLNPRTYVAKKKTPEKETPDR